MVKITQEVDGLDNLTVMEVEQTHFESRIATLDNPRYKDYNYFDVGDKDVVVVPYGGRLIMEAI